MLPVRQPTTIQDYPSCDLLLREWLVYRTEIEDEIVMLIGRSSVLPRYEAGNTPTSDA